MDFEEKKNLFKIRKTVLEMLEDRKYNIPKNEIIDFDEFSIKYNSKNIDIFIDSGSEELGKIYVYFHNENKSLSKVELKNKINKLIEQYEDENLKIIILAFILLDLLEPIYTSSSFVSFVDIFLLSSTKSNFLYILSFFILPSLKYSSSLFSTNTFVFFFNFEI